MNVLGIIAEYNPLHNGHVYHLQEARQKAQADGVICVMSGNFVQRGEPAIVDKWARAKMAISQGADLVFELPTLYATRSAYWFAKGGVLTLYHTGIVSHLAFGVETPQPALLNEIAVLLAQEPEAFQHRLRQALKEGLSFPRARARALPPELAQHAELLQSPNNVLALAYLQVLREEKIPIIPIMLERKGSGYLEQNLTKDTLPSATAVRHRLTTNYSFLAKLADLTEYLPQTTVEILQDEYQTGKAPVSLQSLESPLLTLLRRITKEDLQQIIEISEGLENRIWKIASYSNTLADFLANLKSKRYTYTRLQRFLIHLLLNYTKSENALLTNAPPYLHLLGYTAKGQELLKKIKKQSTIPLITKGSQIKQYLPTNAVLQRFWEFDVRATNLYALLYPQTSVRTGNLDYLQHPASPSITKNP